MDEHSPHKTLLALHRLVDDGIASIFNPLELDFATETILTVDRADLDALAHGTDPQSVLLTIEHGPQAPVVLVAEPALCSTILARIWRNDRNAGAPLTQVENAILQQFLHDVCSRWTSSWREAGIESLPAFTMAATLSMLRPQMPDGPWYVARTVVFDGDNKPAGVLLFCYPARLLPTLMEAQAKTTWRHRVERGLTDAERMMLNERLDRLGALTIPAPVTLRTEVPLRLINQLEVGDVVSLDAPVGGDMTMRVLDREITARLARRGPNLALAVTGPLPQGGDAPIAGPNLYAADADPYAAGTQNDPSLDPQHQ